MTVNHQDVFNLIKTGQYGRLYIVSHSDQAYGHVRVYVLPEGEEAIPNGRPNGPLNKTAVLVYGEVDARVHPSVTRNAHEWKHHGPWQQDFEKLLAALVAERDAKADAEKSLSASKALSRARYEDELLASYPSDGDPEEVT